MAIYTIQTPPGATGDAQDLQAEIIPESKALMALVFPLPWLLWNRLWWATLFYVLLSVALYLALRTDFAILALMMTFIPGLYLFLEGYQLRRNYLTRRGWKLVGVVEANDKISAETRYFHQHSSSRKQRAAMSAIGKKPNQWGSDMGDSMDFLAGPGAN